eukprot:GEMP01006475.1.p1 GENE.GEMP01006475.1~~GEMP01006475.1.p1  ORF type:complete len:679 (+),score=192.61 GEMP01006475.1:164-2200(+)
MKFLGLSLVLAVYQDAAVESTANPIRRVVNMLQTMQKKVSEEGQEEAELFENFQCYCKKNISELTKSIAAAQLKISQLEAQIQEYTSKKNQIDEELRNHEADRKEAQDGLSAATKLRKEEAGKYAEESGDTGLNIEALAKAIAAISKGLGGSFVQTQGGERFKRILLSWKFAADRDMLTMFLSSTANSPGSAEVVGILKEIKDDLERDLGNIVKDEYSRKTGYEQLRVAKTKEIAATTQAIEEKTERSGVLAVRIVEAKEDLKDTMAALSQDEQFQVNLRRDCKKREGEFAERKKTRAEELLAITSTIKILNDDDALDLFKKTLTGKNSFLQASAADSVRERAKNIISQVAQTYKGNNFDFLSLALSGKNVNFSKVIAMADNMVTILAKEQKDDDAHKEYCTEKFDTSDGTARSISRNIQNLQNTKEETDNISNNLNRDIETLKEGVKSLDQQVAQATEQRKQEHAEFVQTFSDNQAAVKILTSAKNHLQKFYNSKLHKEAPKREMSDEERVYTNFGGESAFLQRMHGEAAPSLWKSGGYRNKGAENTGVLAMIDMLVNDVKKEMREAELTETSSQEDYESLMSDSQKKRALDSKLVTTKEGAKAESDTQIQDIKENLRGANQNRHLTAEYINNLHKSCDFLMENYDFRKSARAQEVDALENAKAVLSGANYAFIQRH